MFLGSFFFYESTSFRNGGGLKVIGVASLCKYVCYASFGSSGVMWFPWFQVSEIRFLAGGSGYRF